MRSIDISVKVTDEELARAASLHLGMLRPNATGGPAFHPRSEAVSAAIGHVVRAVEKFDRDQYSPGAGAAATALFEAGKRLRRAVSEEQKIKSMKGQFHV
jgi:hypothetical protein